MQKVSFESKARGKKNKINPWENVIDTKIRKADIETGSGLPVFHKRFKLKDEIKTCKIHLTALGCFNLYMNGQKIGTDELMPGWTDYEKRVLYYTYDVTPFAAQDNAVAVPVSSGWWAGRISLDTYGENDTAFICVIETEYQNGDIETICSDLTWRGTTSGPVRYADIWDGKSIMQITIHTKPFPGRSIRRVKPGKYRMNSKTLKALFPRKWGRA